MGCAGDLSGPKAWGYMPLSQRRHPIRFRQLTQVTTRSWRFLCSTERPFQLQGVLWCRPQSSWSPDWGRASLTTTTQHKCDLNGLHDLRDWMDRHTACRSRHYSSAAQHKRATEFAKPHGHHLPAQLSQVLGRVTWGVALALWPSCGDEELRISRLRFEGLRIWGVSLFLWQSIKMKIGNLEICGSEACHSLYDHHMRIKFWLLKNCRLGIWDETVALWPSCENKELKIEDLYIWGFEVWHWLYECPIKTCNKRSGTSSCCYWCIV